MLARRLSLFWLLPGVVLGVGGLSGAGCSVDERSLSVVTVPLQPDGSDLADAGVERGSAPTGDGGTADGAGRSERGPTPGELIVTQMDVPIAVLPLSLGQACSAGSLPCEATLRCVDGSCRQPCVASSDCAALGGAARCTVGAALDGSGVGACNYETFCDPAHPQAPQAPAQACPAGSGCSASESGESACAPQPGGALEGGACVSDLNCAPGFFCGGSGTCRRYCLRQADCGEGVCSFFAPPRRAGDLGVGFCAATSACDPVHPQTPRDGLSICPVGTACRSEDSGASVCYTLIANPVARYEACSSGDACQPGLFCGGGDVAGFCNQFCFSDADCGGGRCRLFTPPSLAGTFPVGSCAELCSPVTPHSSDGGFGVCPDGFGCVVPSDGNSVCLKEGSLQRYDRCTTQQCASGLGCGTDQFAYCTRQCLSDDDCGRGRCRDLSLRVGDTPVGTCAEVCDPTDAQSNAGPFTACPAGFGCIGDPNGASICVLNGNKGFDARCSLDVDCASGFVCDSFTLKCAKYCFDDADCEGRRCSISLDPPSFADTRALRFCDVR